MGYVSSLSERLASKPRNLFFAALAFLVSYVISLNLKERVLEESSVTSLAAAFTAGAAAGLPDDAHFGYTEEYLLHFLQRLGGDGRHWYIIYELVDLFFVIPSYGAAWCLILGWLRRKSQGETEEERAEVSPILLGAFEASYSLPTLVVALDVFEDLLHLWITAHVEDSLMELVTGGEVSGGRQKTKTGASGGGALQWSELAAFSSDANKLKWFATLAFPFVVLFWVAVYATRSFFRSARNRKTNKMVTGKKVE